MPRKHLIASGINRKQQQQAKVWMKCAREIQVAAKVGGPNPETNYRLKTAIDRALRNNLSRDSIQKNIKGAEKNAENLKEITYEGYGPNGVAIMIRALTDNEQRTISNLRGYFSKLHGQISKPNSVKMLFDELGVIVLNRQDEEKIFEVTLELPVDRVEEDAEHITLLVQPEHYEKCKTALETNSVPVLDAEIQWVANSTVALNDEDGARLEKFIESCEDDDDVQWVVTNWD